MRGTRTELAGGIDRLLGGGQSIVSRPPVAWRLGSYPRPQPGSAVLGNERTSRQGGACNMPPRGVKKGSKRARQYEHVRESARNRGVSSDRAEEIAARTVNKERAR